MRTALGLDLQANCGHALLSMTPGVGTISTTGTWDCSSKATSHGVDLEVFEYSLRQGLSCSVDKVFYVHARNRKSRRSDQYVALKDRMMQVCAEVGVACEALSRRQMKTFATGNGKANREEMDRAADIFGHDEFNHETSAVFVARYGMECFDDV